MFGVGMAVAGWCPGTCTAALGEAKYLALIGVVGLLVGAAVHAESFPIVAQLMKGSASTLPQLLGTNPLLTALVAGVLFIAAAVAMNRRRP